VASACGSPSIASTHFAISLTGYTHTDDFITQCRAVPVTQQIYRDITERKHTRHIGSHY